VSGSRKYAYPPHGWPLEILRGWGSQKSKFLKESTCRKLHWNLLRGGGRESNQETIHGEGMDIF